MKTHMKRTLLVAGLLQSFPRLIYAQGATDHRGKHTHEHGTTATVNHTATSNLEKPPEPAGPTIRSRESKVAPVASTSSVGHDELPRSRDISEQLAELAVEQNPSVDAIARRISALREKIDRAGAWMDPIVSAEYSNMPLNAPYPGQHPMSGIQFMVKQTFYWPGKIETREDEARAQVRQVQLSLAEQKVQLRANVMRAYYRLAATRQLKKVTLAHVALVKEFVQLIGVKNAAGTGAQHELLRLKVLHDQLRDDLKNFDQDERALCGVINGTLHRALDVDIPTPEQTVTAEPVAEAESLIRKAEMERPLLKRFDAEAVAFRAAAKRAAREGYPDITVWAGYRVRTAAGTDPGTDFVSLGLSVPLPLSYDSRSGSEQRQNEKMADAALQDKAAALDEIRGQLARTVANWQRAAQQARTYRELLTPEAKMALESTFSAYQVDRADFASLFQAELQLLNFERTTRMAEMNAAEAQVEADALVGTGATK